MANANTTSGVLKSAGCEQITLRRCDLPITIGRDIDEAVKFVMDVGPAGEILRLAAARAAHLHKPVADALRAGLADWAGSDGVIAPLIDMDRHRQHPRRSRTLLMLARFRSRLTFANVVSLMALFVALGGGAYAMTIAKDSVGATQLNKNADTRSKWRFVAARKGSL